MKIIVNGKTYHVNTEDSTTLRQIEAQLPLKLTFRRNHDVEFVGDLPRKPANDGRKISAIHPGGIYYYEGWNVFCLNYAEGDISPYFITYLGAVDDAQFSEELKAAPDQITAEITE